MYKYLLHKNYDASFCVITMQAFFNVVINEDVTSGLRAPKGVQSLTEILQPPPVFYQPNTRIDENLSGEITVAFGSRLETADNEETIRLAIVAKAIPVPPYKEDSSFETSSRENGSPCSDPTNDTSKETNSAVVSIVCIHTLAFNVVSLNQTLACLRFYPAKQSFSCLSEIIGDRQAFG
uniref:Uncharacterized protein n=1 Tax=Magallana gigas TaxID=29159 RepID=K1Q5W0_MAGGI